MLVSGGGNGEVLALGDILEFLKRFAKHAPDSASERVSNEPVITGLLRKREATILPFADSSMYGLALLSISCQLLVELL